jgi:class 3 adenylate cyclase/tetratricopeptide (TPR) repeat protein
MKCPKCQTENPQKNRFCRECGTDLLLGCPQCGAEVLARDKFCGKCGNKLDKALETEEKVPKTEGERKHVTVLFSDLSGYTAMSERLDPEEVKEITRRIFGEVSLVISKYEGFVEKFVGDAVMAVFGATKAYEDDPIKAINAAREIHRLVESLSPEYEKRIGQPLSMHTGINTGLVVTGEVNLKKGTHGIVGDAINMAARLSSLGKEGDILVGPGTYTQAEGYFDFETLDPTTVKGKAKPIQVYRVISRKDQPRKVHRLQGVRAKLIGRKVEMAQLKEAADNLQKGTGSTFAVCGPAGTGKSRLVDEFKSNLDLKEIQWREGHAYPYAQNIPYFPLINLLNRAFQIEEGDPPEKVREKVENGIVYLVGEKEDAVPYVGSLYSLSYPEIDNVSPEFWKSKLQKAFQAVLSGLAQRGPTIICLEDLHWADPSSLELIRLILSDFRGPILFLCIYRPIITLLSSHQVNAMANPYQEIRLQDLSPSESQDMVESLLNTENVPPELRRFVQEKVEGNPFYLEEISNSLIESKTLIRDNGSWRVTQPITETDISSTIHGVISARLDRLEKETKRVLQEASVIGRTFYYEILKKITELKGNIDQCLSGLERLDLIKARSLEPDLEYIFKHALTQEVVYNGLLKKERKEIHERIGLVMEQLFRDRLPEFYETLAFHFQQGQSVLKSVYYLMKSGEKSLKRYALEESHKYFAEAFELLTNKPEKSLEEKRLIIDLIIKWALVFYYRCDIKGWINLFSSHIALAKSIEDQERLAMLYAWLGFGCLANDNKQSLKLLRKALEIGEKLENKKIIGYACTWLTWTCCDLCLFDEAIHYGTRAQGIAKLVESDHYLYFKSLGGIGMTYWQKGDSKKLVEVGRELLEYGQRHANIRSQTMGHMVLGGAYNLVGDYSMFIKCFQKAFEVSADTMYDTVAKTYMGMGYILNDQVQEAEAPLKEVISFCREYNFDWVGMPAQVFLGVVMIAKGNMSQGYKMIEDALKTFIREERRYFIALTEHIIGKIYSQIVEGAGPISPLSIAKNIGFLAKNVPFADKKAESHFNKAIEVAKEIGAKSLLGPLYLDLGLLHKANKRTDKARWCLAEAIQIFEQCEAKVYLKQVKEVLGSL